MISVIANCEGNGVMGSHHLFTTEDSISVGRDLLFQQRVCEMSLKSIIIDKDNTEIKALRTFSPVSDVNLCRYHVQTYFRRSVVVTYLPEEKREAACDVWRTLNYASTEDEWDKSWAALELISDAVPPLKEVAGGDYQRPFRRPPTLMGYVKKNWFNNRKNWALLYQKWTLNRGRLTNCQNGRHNGVTKDDVGLQTDLC